MTLTDTGPLVALLDKDDSAHAACFAAAQLLPPGPLLTTWPCFTEAMYFLGDLKGWNGQKTLWQFIERGALRVHISTDSETQRMRVLMEKYSDTPMDLADASLVAIAESQGLHRIFTLDRDFGVYRINGTTAFEVVP